MATFKPVLPKILAIEGGIVDDPDDDGGLTWQGVAYNYYPRWAGWKIVFKIMELNPKSTALFRAKKSNPAPLNKALYAQIDLAILVADFYEKLYWDVNRLDEISDQQLAQNVCDCGVNCGTGTGAKMLQRAYNKVYFYTAPPLKDDGQIGTKTLWAINMSDPVKIYNEYNTLRKAYYDAIIERKPSQVKFRKSWYSRIIPYKP